VDDVASALGRGQGNDGRWAVASELGTR
jgi:hypothetical protein